MGKKLSPQLKASRKKFRTESKLILIESANDAVNHFKNNFKISGFLDRRVHTWKSRKGEKKVSVFTKKKDREARGVLIKTGKLKKSIARTHLSSKRTIIGIKGVVAPKYASVHNFGLRSGRGSGFKMPKRQFMGESHVLNKKISRLIKRRIKKIL